MEYFTSRIKLKTRARSEIIDITGQVRDIVRESGIMTGTCIVFSLHTTCGITINENADPDVKRDIVAWLGMVYPESGDYRHIEGNSDAHLKVSTVGPSQVILVEDGDLILGTWQGIMLCEFDGPRTRTVIVRVQGKKS